MDGRNRRRGLFETLEARHLLSASALYNAPVQLDNPSPDAYDAFGTVAVDNGITVVGVPDDDTAGTNAGLAYLYLDNASSPPIALQSPDAASDDHFGVNVAIAGMTVAIAESGDEFDELNSDAGSIHLYDIPTATWKKIQHPDPHNDSEFGANGLALTSDVLLVSSNNLSTDTPVESKVYAIDPTDGSLLRSFTLPGPQRPLVSEIDVDGDWVLIGSSDYEEIFSTTDIGRTFLWNWRTGDAVNIENPSPDQDDFFGESVAIDGTTIVISSPGDDTDGSDRGLAYIYTFDPANGTVGDFHTVSNQQSSSGTATLPSTPNSGLGFSQNVETHDGLVWLGSTFFVESSYSITVESHVTVVDTQSYSLEEIEIPDSIISKRDFSIPFYTGFGIADDIDSDSINGYGLPSPYTEISTQDLYGIEIVVDGSNDNLVVADRSAFVTNAAAAGSLLVYEQAFSNTFIVNSTDDSANAATAAGTTTLRAAIQQANATGEVTLIILPPGTYKLDLLGDGNAAGDLDIHSNVTIRGAGAGLSILDASGLTGERIFDVMGTLNLSGVTLTGADISAGENGLGGGAIWVRSTGTLELNDSVVTGNTAGTIGGGIYNAGTLMVNRSVISQNHSTGHGGGIRNVGTAQLMSSVIAKNSGNGNGPDLRGHFTGDIFNFRTMDSGSFGLFGAGGGKVDMVVTEFADHADATFDTVDLSLREAIIAANAAGGPVTIWLPAGHHQLDLVGKGSKAGDLDITGEITIKGPGAGLAIIDASTLTGERIFDISGTLTLDGVTLTGADITEGTNGTSGGAVWVRRTGTLRLQESAVTGNTAGGVGGGIYNAGTLDVTDSVITKNRSGGLGGGIRAVGMATLRNTIIANNTGRTGSIGGHDVFGHFSSDGSNLLTSNRGSTGLHSDYVKNVYFVVTSIEDAFDHSDDHIALTLREAVDQENRQSGRNEIWLPAWHFKLSLDGDGGVEVGSIDVDNYLRLRGTSAAKTRIDATGIVDKAFDNFDVTFLQYDVQVIDN